MNLINIARDYFSEEVLNQIGDKVGISPDNIQDVVGKLFPSLLGAVGERAKSAEGAETLLNLAKDEDDSLLGDLLGKISGDSDAIQEKGLSGLTSLFGEEGAGSVISKLAGFSGISSEKASGILGLLTPMLTGLIGKQVSSNGLNVSGLQSLMKEQEAHISEAAGSDFLGKLGLGSLIGGIGGLGAIAGGAGDKISGLTGAAGDKVSGAVDAVGDKVADITGAAGDKVSGAVDAVADKVSGVSGAAGDAVKGLGDKAVGAVGAAGDKVSGAVGAAGGKATEVVGAAGDKAGAVVGSAGDAVKGIGGKAAGAVGGAAAGAGAAAKSAGGAAAGGAKKGGKGILALIPIILLGILAFFLVQQCGILDKAGDAAGAVGDGAKNLGEGAVDGIKGAGDAIGEGASALGEGAKNLGEGAVDGIKGAGDAIGDGASALGEGAKNLGEGAVDGIKGAGDAIGEGASALGEGAKNLGEGAVDGIKGAGDAIGDGASALGEGAKNLGEDAVDGIKGAGDAIGEGAGKVVDAIKGFGHADNPNLSGNVKSFAAKLSNIDTSDASALDKVYAELSADGTSSFMYRIPFQTGETGVPSAHQEALIAKLKTADKDATLVTIGYADTRGDDAANMKLSYGRAEEVGAWIKSTLGNDTKIESFSMGETDRFSKDDFSKNRVVEVWQVAK